MLETTERIDIEKLKQRERICFYDDIMLFEDELSDNGCSVLSVKIVSVFHPFGGGGGGGYVVMCMCLFNKKYLNLKGLGWGGRVGEGKHLQDEEDPYL